MVVKWLPDGPPNAAARRSRVALSRRENDREWGGMTGPGRAGNGVPADVRTDIAHPARVYDYWLGGYFL